MGTGVEIKEGEVFLSINPKTYTLEHVYSTAYVFLDRCYVLFDGDPATQIVVRLKPKSASVNLEELGRTFMNELISISNYFLQFEKNKDVINAVLQRALFSASPKLVAQAEEAEINRILEEVQRDVQ